MTDVDTTLRSEIRSHIERFVRQACDYDGGPVTDDVPFAQLDLDSLELVAMVQELQRTYEVALNDERLLGIDRVGQAVDLVALRVQTARGQKSDSEAGEE
jgi:acyl carrier protein